MGLRTRGSLHEKKEMRDTKLLNKFFEQSQKKWKEMVLFRNLKKEVETGANGTQDYIIKEGPNKNKIAKK
jgi:hypothetical protein